MQRKHSSMQALAMRDYDRAESISNMIAWDPNRAVGDRIEALRVLGLSRFFKGDQAGARLAFFEYLRLDTEAHLDPGLVPPEAIVFFDEASGRVVKVKNPDKVKDFVGKKVTIVGELVGSEEVEICSVQAND